MTTPSAAEKEAHPPASPRRPAPAALALALGLALLLLAAPALASIAKVTRVSGEVLLRSGEAVTPIKAPGAPLQNGDQIQVQQGEAEVLFHDGAILRINAFSNALLQERQEESGFWIFKSSAAARRITCMVGKLFFQSGVSGKRNYLQTPTAVAGIRGSSGDVGFDNLNSYLNMYAGEAQVLGAMIRGVFQNPGVTAAQRSVVYQALVNAQSQTQQAQATGRPLAIEQARVTVLQVATRVAEVLQTNPDPVVRTDAALVRTVAVAAIDAVQARVAVAQIAEDKAAATAAQQAAQQRGETALATRAAEAAAKADQDRLAAEKAATAAAQAAAAAAQAAEQRNAAAAAAAAVAAQQAAQQAQQAAQTTRNQLQNVVPTTTSTVAPTTVAPTTAGTTVAPTTTATTTVPTTVPTTTSSTTSTTSTSSTTSSTTVSTIPPSR